VSPSPSPKAVSDSSSLTTAPRARPLEAATTDAKVGATIAVPQGWTVLPNRGGTETVAMGLDAPPDYTNTPTRIGILALMGRWDHWNRPNGAASMIGISRHRPMVTRSTT